MQHGENIDKMIEQSMIKSLLYFIVNKVGNMVNIYA